MRKTAVATMLQKRNVFLQKRNSVEKDEKDGRGDDVAEKKRVFAEKK